MAKETSRARRACILPGDGIGSEAAEPAADVLRPAQFGVLLAENAFGDIWGVLTGSIGDLPSASVGGGPVLDEPENNSAPDLVGRNLANPTVTISCDVMMMDFSFGRPQLGSRIPAGVEAVLARAFCTADLERSGGRMVGTSEFAGKVLEELAGGRAPQSP